MKLRLMNSYGDNISINIIVFLGALGLLQAKPPGCKSLRDCITTPQQ